MIVGYARVSTEEQKLDLQRSALKGAGCNRIYEDQGRSGASFEREGLEAALDSVKPGGTLVVWRLDRLGRSLSGLIQLIDQLGKRQVQFRSVMENIDTGSSGGRLMFHMMAALAEFERALISERTRAGLAEARARGSAIGRPKVLSEDDVLAAEQALRSEGLRMRDVAEHCGVSVRTLQRRLKLARARLAPPPPADPEGLRDPSCRRDLADDCPVEASIEQALDLEPMGDDDNEACRQGALDEPDHRKRDRSIELAGSLAEAEDVPGRQKRPRAGETLEFAARQDARPCLLAIQRADMIEPGQGRKPSAPQRPSPLWRPSCHATDPP